jgi:asparagine synthase (glutamine-hydrolysing)
VVNIPYLLTLRYDPTCTPRKQSLRTINSDDIFQARRNSFLTSKVKNDTGPYQDLEKELRNYIRSKIEESEERHVTVALSSGIDSNLILFLVRKEFPHLDIDCLTVSFNDDSSESQQAKKVAESQNAVFHEISVEDPLRDLPKLLNIIKEPRWNIYQYYFIEKARSMSSILFTGDGGDELFAGYTFRYKKFLENNNAGHTWIDRVQLYLHCHERDWVPDQHNMFGRKLEFDWDSIFHLLRGYFDNKLDPLEQVLIADYHGKLMYDFVTTNNKYFEHFDIKGVAPLLSKKVIDLSIRIPSHNKYEYNTNIGKIPLREIIKRITALSLCDYTEDQKNKRGFGMDLVNFWFKSGKETVTSQLDNGRILQDGIIDKQWYTKSLSRIYQHRDIRYISKMLQLLSLEVWYKLFITHEISPSTTL